MRNSAHISMLFGMLLRWWFPVLVLIDSRLLTGLSLKQTWKSCYPLIVVTVADGLLLWTYSPLLQAPCCSKQTSLQSGYYVWIAVMVVAWLRGITDWLCLALVSDDSWLDWAQMWIISISESLLYDTAMIHIILVGKHPTPPFRWAPPFLSAPDQSIRKQ